MGVSWELSCSAVGGGLPRGAGPPPGNVRKGSWGRHESRDASISSGSHAPEPLPLGTRLRRTHAQVLSLAAGGIGARRDLRPCSSTRPCLGAGVPQPTPAWRSRSQLGCRVPSGRLAVASPACLTRLAGFGRQEPSNSLAPRNPIHGVPVGPTPLNCDLGIDAELTRGHR